MIAPSNRLAAVTALALLVSWLPESSAQRAVAQPSETAAFRELLNSERIEQEFGSYGLEVLHSDAMLRISNLYSESDGSRTGRTFAVVLYPSEIDPLFAAEHATILDGGSIGAVFASAGWSVTKRHLWYGELESSARLADLMRIEEGLPLAVHVYVLHVSKAAASFEYAALAEIHHPEYLHLDELRPIYGAPAAERPDADPLLRRILEAARVAAR
jgi:hypothetical protein